MKKLLSVMMACMLIISLTGCQLMNSIDDRMHETETSEETKEAEASQESAAESKAESSEAQESSQATEESSAAEESNGPQSGRKDESSKPEESSKEEESSQPEESSQAEESEESKAETPAAPLGQYTGEFSSDTETALNVVVKWSANQNQDTFYTISVQFYLECYSLEAGARSDNVMIVRTSKEEKEYTFRTEEIDKEEDEFSEIYLGKTSFSVPESEFNNGVQITVEWPFWGTYSEKEIEIIKAEGVIKPN